MFRYGIYKDEEIFEIYRLTNDGRHDVLYCDSKTQDGKWISNKVYDETLICDTDYMIQEVESIILNRVMELNRIGNGIYFVKELEIGD